MPAVNSGPQGDLAPTLVLKRVHLFVDDVGALADAAHIQPGLFKDGHVEALIVIEPRHATDLIIDVQPVGLVLGQVCR